MSKIDIKAFRKANRLSQRDLADFLGVGQGFISQIESGDRPMPMNLLDKILEHGGWDTTAIVPDRPIESELVNSLKETIKAQRETIEYQKEIISLLKEGKGIPARPALGDAHSASSTPINP